VKSSFSELFCNLSCCITVYFIDYVYISVLPSGITINNEQPFYGHLIQDNPGEPVLSQRRDLLGQSLDFYEPDVLPATHHIVSGKPSG